MRFVVDEEALVPEVLANYSTEQKWYSASVGLLDKTTAPNI
jgi:hypothetical protein